jgi:hypothetical protein
VEEGRRKGGHEEDEGIIERGGKSKMQGGKKGGA